MAFNSMRPTEAQARKIAMRESPDPVRVYDRKTDRVAEFPPVLFGPGGITKNNIRQMFQEAFGRTEGDFMVEHPVRGKMRVHGCEELLGDLRQHAEHNPMRILGFEEDQPQPRRYLKAAPRSAHRGRDIVDESRMIMAPTARRGGAAEYADDGYFGGGGASSSRRTERAGPSVDFMQEIKDEIKDEIKNQVKSAMTVLVKEIVQQRDGPLQLLPPPPVQPSAGRGVKRSPDEALDRLEEVVHVPAEPKRVRFGAVLKAPTSSCTIEDADDVADGVEVEKPKIWAPGCGPRPDWFLTRRNL